MTSASTTLEHSPSPAKARGDAPFRRLVLGCGILSSLVYVAANIFGTAYWHDYSSTAQTVSELFALGAPSRPVVVPLLLAYDALLITFGWGVWRSSGRKRSMRLSGALLIAIGVVGVLGPPWVSMHLRGTPGTLTDSMHIALTVVISLLTVLAIGLAAAARKGWFRVYSIATLLVLVVFGTLAGLDGPRIAAQLPTPWVGVTERIDIGSYLLWVAVLAIVLLREKDTDLDVIQRARNPA